MIGLKPYIYPTYPCILSSFSAFLILFLLHLFAALLKTQIFSRRFEKRHVVFRIFSFQWDSGSGHQCLKLIWKVILEMKKCKGKSTFFQFFNWFFNWNVVISDILMYFWKILLNKAKIICFLSAVISRGVIWRIWNDYSGCFEWQ